MSELEIPERAYEAGERACNQPNPSVAGLRLGLDSAMEAAAPIIVAAELRRLADLNDPVARVAHVWLRERADELDPQ